MIKLQDKRMRNKLLKVLSADCQQCDIIIKRVTDEELDTFLSIHHDHIGQVACKAIMLQMGAKHINPELEIRFESTKAKKG